MEEMKKRILIVDNHPDNGRFLADYFLAAGHEAIWTREADEALEYCIQSWPSIIILEMRVAGIDGVSLLEILKSEPNFQAIPVICMSADVIQRQIDRAKALGARAFVAKPCSNALLAEMVETLSRPPYQYSENGPLLPLNIC